jgi:alpha-mannosidase
MAVALPCVAREQNRIYIAPDDHTDFIWSATEAEYEKYFVDMLDYHVARADEDIRNGVPVNYQNRFTVDGAYWFWIYEKNRSSVDFLHLGERLKSGHFSVNMAALNIMYGAMPTEAVLRQMYYAGTLERRFGVRLPMAWSTENAGMPLGVGSLWAGAGARYSWAGVCNCVTHSPQPRDREHEIYRWRGLDGRDILMKWYSIPGTNESIGGYAEGRNLDDALEVVAGGPFRERYRSPSGKRYSVVGIFGYGWDDRETLNTVTRDRTRQLSRRDTQYFVSNTQDFFEDFARTYGDDIPVQSASFGLEWDRQASSLAEVSATVKRSLEKLRAAEALATLVSLENPNFMVGREGARDLAQLDFGLYFEHDFTTDAPGAKVEERLAFQRRVAKEIQTYVDTLYRDARQALGQVVSRHGSRPRFYVFNPLSFPRTDVVDLPYVVTSAVRVIDLLSGRDVLSQPIGEGSERRLRIEAHDVPPLGYRVYEVVPGQSTPAPSALFAEAVTGHLVSPFYDVKVDGRGAIISLRDRRAGNRELVKREGALNVLGNGTGVVTVQDAGPISATLVATSSADLTHVSRITVFGAVPRIAIDNEINRNFREERGWRYDFQLEKVDTWHEEVGAVIRAKLVTNGGHYAARNTRYDYLTLNHFVAMNGADGFGVTLSNADTLLMKLGNSSIATLDSTTPSVTVVAGGQFEGLPNQGGDSNFLQRFALGTHRAFSAAESMRFSLAHQNPLIAGEVTGQRAVYPEKAYSLLSVSDKNVLVWALKPAQDGGVGRVALRLWNLGNTGSKVTVKFAKLLEKRNQVTHIETPLASAVGGQENQLVVDCAAQQLNTYLVELGPKSVELPLAIEERETFTAPIATVMATPGGNHAARGEQKNFNRIFWIVGTISVVGLLGLGIVLFRLRYQAKPLD